jgi:hypothetical protein
MICIRFYCDMKPTSKTVVPWLVRTTLSMVLYEIDICMKLFNMAFFSSSASVVGLIERHVSLLLNCIKNRVVAIVALQNKEDVSHRNTKNLFSVSVGTISSMHLM